MCLDLCGCVWGEVHVMWEEGRYVFLVKKVNDLVCHGL